MNMPIEVVYIVVGVSVAIIGIGFFAPNSNMKNNKGNPLLLFAVGITWISFFTALTGIDGLNDDDKNITYNNVTKTIIENDVTTPFNWDNSPKMIMMFLGSMVMLIGGLMQKFG